MNYHLSQSDLLGVLLAANELTKTQIEIVYNVVQNAKSVLDLRDHYNNDEDFTYNMRALAAVLFTHRR
jgi:hypothetical protein